MGLPTLIVVSGPAGSGKTTLAHNLALIIGCPAICRDEIKEGMVHASRAHVNPELGDPLTQRTLLVFFETLRVLLRAGVTVVAEAAFQDPIWRSHLEPLSDLAQFRIIQCRVETSLARQRIADRPFRPAHADESLLALADYFDDFVRLSLPAPVIDVDTTDGYKPPLDQIVSFVHTDS